MLLCLRILLALVLLLALPLHPGRAAESNIVATDHDSVSLVSETDGFTPGRELTVGLRLRLAPGWHTYWSNPGDAGEAPTVDIVASGASSGHATRIDWPAPLRLPDGPLMSYGYVGDVVLPVRLSPATTGTAGGGPLLLSASAEWLACASVCVPEHGSFSLRLPQGTLSGPSAQAPLFAQAAARQPLPSPFKATLTPDGLELSGSGLGPAVVHDAWFFPAAPGLIDQIAAQRVTVTPGLVRIGLKPLPDLARAHAIDGLVVLRDAAGNESMLSVSAPHAATGTKGTAASPGDAGGFSLAALPRLLLLALLGGIVLNLMPCVFPVLAMKALAFSRIAGSHHAEQRLSAAFYTAGVLAAFAALGALMLGLRAAGSAAGWGFQFQSPLFVAAICWLLFAVGLNLAGLFEIGGSFAGFGQGLAARRGHAGDFATGLLAVLVATPCTAPFMGVAIVGALAAPAAVGMAVFLTMGLGLALPYAVFTQLPGLARRLPRPGTWMLVLRQALSFPLFAACAWLAWVLSIEAGDRGILVLAAGLVLLAFAGWLVGLSQRIGVSATWRARSCLLAAALSTVAALVLLPALAGRQEAGASALPVVTGSEPFSEARLAELRRQGRPVLVDMTAAWCVTCLVNERLALTPPAVQRAFASHHVVTLRGDWTRRDERIGSYLRDHGRDGVPFYIFYPAGREGHVLPQILTAGRVLQEVDGA
ncbi:protein-disulfide reductase DsbD family protein [Lichenicoccus sp.]|uniref:protein-disulfide reductase DsbD family protein n=1 Tax=Lichenicoccus sp. TaxID=2781899 RepID=UPI003D113AEE